MLETDPRVAEALDQLVPVYAGERGDWDAVARAARRRRAPRSALALIPAVAAVLALALAWPSGDGPRGGVLERALAVVGDGPVVHVVLRGDWGGVDVHLDSGRRTPVYGETELWYDRDRNVVRSVNRLGGVVQDEEVYEPTEGPREEILALAVEYREALASGSADVAGRGEVDGEPVYWVTIRRGPPHSGWERQVAVSRRTFEPVATRSARDGEAERPFSERILELETLPQDAVDLDRPLTPVARGPYRYSTGFAEKLTLAEARARMEGRLLWAGSQLEGLPLTWIGAVEDSGPEGDVSGVLLAYGRLTEIEAGDARFGGPYVTVRQTLGRLVSGDPGVAAFVPPPGEAFVRGGSAYLARGGVDVRVTATTGEPARSTSRRQELVLAAARALRPYP